MATQYSTAVSQPAPYQRHAYRKSAQYSPTGSAMHTPMNISPSSPRNTQAPMHQQQHMGIRPLKTAIGVPAALRKTERPIKQSPPKVDSARTSPNNGWVGGSPFGQLSNDRAVTPVSQVGNEDMHSIYNDVPMSPTAGPITRNHWQADGSTSVCSASACQTPFGLFNRRHHCRKCGGVFCWQHSSKQVRLDELARFHVEGELYRACDRCHGSFREWEHLRSSRTNSESSGSSAAAIQVEAPVMPKRPDLRVGSLAQSFQGAWNWSTF
ncbi:hypothetical protein P153DRAFT_301284 [Dothidotthia symphoricarpi CBS 119687]|uniref:FYVE-type domain-containing protein n=1 Tax=Dothidotthia symphoricarpi CBS 119687 TaxID=1392245 RepID=A0A6A5ZYL3_9PLEO|nr:uncharacterized protein P153DRAFT_301284 [Dothidotthia symphoricarpi CBS 119687]KAF2124680.1 hypothetical protein P153DRAFT_301284 [Dothidotthia symphoricarpi CBS 119687]